MQRAVMTSRTEGRLMAALGGKLTLGRLLFGRGEGKGSLLAEVPEGNADRAQGLGHRLRNSQAQSLPRHTT